MGLIVIVLYGLAGLWTSLFFVPKKAGYATDNPRDITMGGRIVCGILWPVFLVIVIIRPKG